MPSPPSMFDAPRPVAAVGLSNSSYIQPNLGHGLRIWWAFYWPTTLIATILTLGVNIALRRLYEDTMVSGSLLGPVMRYDAYVFNYSVALFVFAYILRKEFRHFHIGLLSHRGGDGAQILKPTFWRTVRVWWTYSWRTIFYLAIAWVVVLLPLSWIVGLFNPGPVFTFLFFAVLGFVIAGAIGLFAIYSNILDEDIADFRVSLLPREAPAVAPAIPAVPESRSASPAGS